MSVFFSRMEFICSSEDAIKGIETTRFKTVISGTLDCGCAVDAIVKVNARLSVGVQEGNRKEMEAQGVDILRMRTDM